MATKEEIIEYVMNSPQNTNRSVLNSMLEHMEATSAIYSIHYEGLEPISGPESAHAGDVVQVRYAGAAGASVADYVIELAGIPYSAVISAFTNKLVITFVMPAEDVYINVTEA